MRLSANDLIRAAYGKYALGAFNVCNMEQIHGLFQGAGTAAAPILVQFTRAIRAYAGPVMLEHMLRAAETTYPGVVFAVHLDHGDPESCAEAAASGWFSSVMIDASHLPFEENITVTREVVLQAHSRGVAVEAELGVLKGIEEGAPSSDGEAVLTDPSAAREFVERTGCDSLAVAVGTSHGAYKFAGRQRLHLDRLAAIQAELPGFPLVLHGASNVSKAEVDRINAAGGRLGSDACGVKDEELTIAAKHGVAKVNIGTDGRLIWTRVHREFFRDSPEAFDFMGPGKTYMREYASFVAAKCVTLGSAAQSTRLQRQSLGQECAQV